MSETMEPSWARRLRLARVARAKKRRKHRRCRVCDGPGTVCNLCGNVICLACNTHECRYAHCTPAGPKPIAKHPAAPARELDHPIPPELQPILTRILAKPLRITASDLFSGYHIVFDRPTSGVTIAELRRTLIDPFIPPGWRAYGVGAEKAGSFYLDLERTEP